MAKSEHIGKKVMFLHGIGGDSDYADFLEGRFREVHSTSMEIDAFNPSRKNSVLNHVIRIPLVDPFFASVLVTCFIGLLMAICLHFPQWPLWLQLPARLVACFLFLACVILWIMRAILNALRACAEQKRRELHDMRMQGSMPDVIFGYSWGGCVTAMLMEMKAWEGPAVLLSPAARRIPNFHCHFMPRCRAPSGGAPALTTIPADLRRYVKVFQGDCDKGGFFGGVCPEGTKQWCNCQGITLTMLEGIGHKPPMNTNSDVAQEIISAIDDVCQAWQERHVASDRTQPLLRNSPNT